MTISNTNEASQYRGQLIHG